MNDVEKYVSVNVDFENFHSLKDVKIWNNSCSGQCCIRANVAIRFLRFWCILEYVLSGVYYFAPVIMPFGFGKKIENIPEIFFGIL